LGRLGGHAEGAGDVGAAPPGDGRVPVAPGGLVDEQVAVEETHRVCAAQAEPELFALDDEVAAGGDGGARGDLVRVRVVVVLHDDTGDVEVGCRGDGQLDPVIGRPAVGLDLVDAHRVAAGVA